MFHDPLPVEPGTVGLRVDSQAVLGERQLPITQLHGILCRTEEGEITRKKMVKRRVARGRRQGRCMVKRNEEVKRGRGRRKREEGEERRVR